MFTGTTRWVAVITEGLINYFNLDTVTPFWGRLAAGLRRFPLGVYLSDNYPLYTNMPFHRTLKPWAACWARCRAARWRSTSAPTPTPSAIS